MNVQLDILSDNQAYGSVGPDPTFFAAASSTEADSYGSFNASNGQFTSETDDSATTVIEQNDLCATQNYDSTVTSNFDAIPSSEVSIAATSVQSESYAMVDAGGDDESMLIAQETSVDVTSYDVSSGLVTQSYADVQVEVETSVEQDQAYVDDDGGGEVVDADYEVSVNVEVQTKESADYSGGSWDDCGSGDWS